MAVASARVPLEVVALVWSGLVDHAEDVAIEPDGTVWCGGEDGQIYRGPLEREPREIARVPGRAYGLTLDGRGNAYCCVVGEPSGLFKVSPTGRVDLLTTGTDERRCVFPNQPAFLADGTLLFTDSGEWGADDGCIFALHPHGATTVADTSACRYPNGIAVTPDGAALAVVESTLPGLSVLSLAPDGSLDERRVLVELPGVVPDGVAFDEDGRVLVACWAPDALFLIADERVEPLVTDPARVSLNSPTNAAFVPGTARVVCANIGERFLSTFEHASRGAALPAPAGF